MTSALAAIDMQDLAGDEGGVFVKSPILPKYRPRIRLPPWGSLILGAMFSRPICMRLTF